MSPKANDEPPPLVRRAADAARVIGMEPSADRHGPTRCTEHTGRLLGLLAARHQGGRIGEIGTGTGYAAAWMAETMGPDATLVTIEIDAARAAVATQLFADDPRVTVVCDDATRVIGDGGPYDLLFVDGAGAATDAERFAELVGLLRVGGTIVVDDVTPLAAQPPDSPFRIFDAKRHAFARVEELWSVEVVAPDLTSSVLVGTRLR